MPFDISTAIQARKRKDGLYEKDTFDISTAMPVTEIRRDISEKKFKPKLTDRDRAQATVELLYKETGEKVPLKTKVDWAITGEKVRRGTEAIINTLVTGGLYPVVQGVRGALDTRDDYSIFDRVTKGILYPEETERIVEKIPDYDELPTWAKITASISEDVLSYSAAGYAKSAAKRALLIRDLNRNIDKAARAFAEEKIGSIPEADALLNPENATMANKIQGMMEAYKKAMIQKLQAIDVDTLKTGVQEYARKRSVIGMLIDEIQSSSLQVGLGIKPVVGNTVSFKAPDGASIVGRIKEIVGNRATIQVGEREILAPLSQLRIPEVKLQPTEGKVEQEVVEQPPIKPPTPPTTTAMQPFNPDDTYARLQEIQKVKKESRVGVDAAKFANKVFVPLSTRAANIDEGIRDSLRNHAYTTGMMTKKDMEAAVPFLESFKKMQPTDAIELDFALKNSDDVKIQEIANKYNIQKEYADVKKTLDGIYAKAKAVGLDVGYLENYFPRRITDINEYIKFLRGGKEWGAIGKALQNEQAELGRELTDDEKAEVINSMIRGYGDDKIRLSRPTATEERKIVQLTPEMNAYYKDSGIALTEYINSMNDNIAARAYFGKGDNLDKSIGAYVNTLIEQDIIPLEAEQELQDILKSYFNKKGTSGIVTGFKNFSYIATMGSPINAITQIGDLAFAFYRNGVFGTLKAMTQKNKITKEDIGINIIASEFTDESKSSKAVSKVFKAIGLEAMDSFGKSTVITAAFNRLSNKAISNDAELIKTVNRVFGGKVQPDASEQKLQMVDADISTKGMDRATQVLEDLKNKVASDDVKYMLFSELSDFQPISLAEMPEAYASGGNSRLWYMLKSYTIKQFDVYHNEIFRQKDPVKKMQNALRLALALMLTGATADVIKDILLHRPIKLSDLVLDNTLRLVGFSKWQTYKTREEGLFHTLLQTVIPPVPFLDEAYKDAVRLMTNKKKTKIGKLKIFNSIPIVGKFYYWWFGGGQDISRKERKKKRRNGAITIKS